MQSKPSVEIDEHHAARASTDVKRAIARSCPKKVYGFNEDSGELSVENAHLCMFCNECTKVADKMKESGIVRVAMSDNHFYFKVETSGALRPDAIVQTAMQVLRDKLNDHANIFRRPDLMRPPNERQG